MSCTAHFCCWDFCGSTSCWRGRLPWLTSSLVCCHPRPPRHSGSALTPRRPFLAAPTSPIVRPASKRRPPSPSRPVRRPPCLSLHAAVRVRSTPLPSSALLPRVPTMAGWGTAISRPTAIPTVAPGANGIVQPARNLSWRPTARRCMASVWCPKSGVGRGHAGGRAGHPRRGAGVRSRPQYRADVVGRVPRACG